MIAPLIKFRPEKLTSNKESAICDLYFILLQLNLPPSYRRVRAHLELL